MTFRILPDATLRVARITQRDKMLGHAAATLASLCSRLSTCHRW